MPWKKPSAAMTDLLIQAVAPFPCQKRMMFGCAVYFVGDYMFVGVFEDSIWLRLSQQDRETIHATYADATPFEPMSGRAMKEYVVLPASLYEDTDTFAAWLERAYQYAATLPPKERKSKRR